MQAPAVFIDKDGTLIENVAYNVDPARIRLAPGARAGLRRLHEAGFRLVLVSNQAGVAFGYFAFDALAAVTSRIRTLLAAFDVPLLDAYYCPHHPDGRVTEFARVCFCRKPRAGMLLRAAYEHQIDLDRSWMIGDILDDIEAGHRAGCNALLIDNGNETEWKLSSARLPDYTVRDLAAAADVICRARPQPQVHN